MLKLILYNKTAGDDPNHLHRNKTQSALMLTPGDPSHLVCQAIKELEVVVAGKALIHI